jgi:3-oxoacyl-[acyl-carrier protein] reductase
MVSYLPLQGKTVLITGASRGLGANMALELAKRGADVIITYTSCSSESLVKELESEIQSFSHKPKSLSIRTDLASKKSPGYHPQSHRGLAWRKRPEEDPYLGQRCCNGTE